MRAQLARRRAQIDAGARPLGWKLGFGSPEALRRLGTRGPLVGHLLQDAAVRDGGTVSLAGWAQPFAEPEVAVHLAASLPAGADAATARGAIAALAPAIELADVDGPNDVVDEILSRNIFQRHVVLGSPDSARAGGSVEGLTARVFRNGDEVAETHDVTALTGDLVDLVRHTAEVLASFGEELGTGAVLIAGSVTPPLAVAPGDRLELRLEPLGRVAVLLR
jgi:2-keto-4-pentenoate hydratase